MSSGLDNSGLASDKSPFLKGYQNVETNLANAIYSGGSSHSPWRPAPPAVASEAASTASPAGQNLLQIVPGQSRNSGDNLYDPHRQDIDQALQKPLAFGGNLVFGGLSGVAFGGPIPRVLNRAADAILLSAEARAKQPIYPAISEIGPVGKALPELRDAVNHSVDLLAAQPKEGSLLYKTAKWYQTNFDEKHLQSAKLQLHTNNFNALNDQVTELMTSDAKAIDTLMAKEASAMTPAETENLSQLHLRKKWLTDPEWQESASGVKLLDKLQTEKIYNPKLFTEAEIELLTGRQGAKIAAGGLTRTQTAFREAGSNFVKGAAIVGVAMVADHYLDKAFTGNDHQHGLTKSSGTEAMPLVDEITKSWNTNTLLVPLAFAKGGFDYPGLLSKAAYTGAAIVAGKFLDEALPASDHQQFSQYLRPTAVDSLLIGGAFLLPAKNKFAMVAGAWALGRIYNAFEGPSHGEVKDQAFDQMKDDMKHRTAGSMNTAIDTFKNLGELDNDALRHYAVDWLRPGRQYDGMLSAYRGAVILADAFGESRLEKGTLVPNKTQKDFILPGQNIDIGGGALRSLIIADVNIDRAKQQCQIDMGKRVQGSKVSQSDLTGLDEVGKRIDSTIQNKIYGKHDIKTVVSGLADFYNGNQHDWLLMKFDLDNSLALNRGSDNKYSKQFVAKLFRDMACMQLGMAEGVTTTKHFGSGDPTGALQALYGADGPEGRQARYNNGQPRGYDGALDAIALAKQFDPNNPDIPQLEAAAAELQRKLPVVAQRQQSNPSYNPLNVNDQLANSGNNP